MKKKHTYWFILIFIYLSWVTQTQAQVILVPNKVKVAGMQVFLTNKAREEVQKKVNSLTCSPRHYKEIFDRINLYLPIIEQTLKEENIPDDFKYLAIQESYLIADEVSVANAVGFWQFKEEGAREVNMRIDSQIDERMHIIASTRGFARYLKKHQDYFQNWFSALLAFHLGRTGARNFLKEKKINFSTNYVKIDHHAHWYLYHFIAHKLVFEKVVGKELHPELCLYSGYHFQGKTIAELSRHFGISQQLIRDYNKWLKKNKVPEDIDFPILIPLTHKQYASIDKKYINNVIATRKLNYHHYLETAKQFPSILYKNQRSSKADNKAILRINGIVGTFASATDDLRALACKGRIKLEDFLKINDIDKNHCPKEGHIYYFQNKNSKANVHYHIVQPQETWWSIAQKYGIRQAALLEKNRAKRTDVLKIGRVLWLRFIRPADIPIAYLQTNKG